MEKLATEEAVWKVCDQLVSENRKVTGRAVVKEVGGSLTTIHDHIRTWKVRDAVNVTVTTDLPADLQKAMAGALEDKAKQATEVLQVELKEATEREMEIMEALSESEERINSLENDLSNAQSEIIALQQNQDKEAGISVERITGLGEQLNRLQQERNEIAYCADTSKAELAKAEVHLEYTMQRAVRAEDKVVELEQQLAALILSKTITEKELAVSERHAEHLSGQINMLAGQLMSAGDKLGDADSMVVGLTLELKDAAIRQSRAEAIAEQLAVRLNESAITVEHLRNEQAAVRKEAADLAAELLTHHGNENDNIVDFKPPMELVPVRHDSIDVAEQEESHPQVDNINMEELRKRMEKVRKGRPKGLEPATGGIANCS